MFGRGSLADAEWSLEELTALADTAGADALETVVQQRDSPDPATYIGRGKVKEIVSLATALDADMLIF
ncbi:MAG: GTPase, partial [Actinomycetota bacterium]|nr:GTPase [Actinomycetota bacterium]